MTFDDLLPGDCLTWSGPHGAVQTHLVLSKPRRRLGSVSFRLLRLEDGKVIKDKRDSGLELGAVWSVLRGGETAFEGSLPRA